MAPQPCTGPVCGPGQWSWAVLCLSRWTWRAEAQTHSLVRPLPPTLAQGRPPGERDPGDGTPEPSS